MPKKIKQSPQAQDDSGTVDAGQSVLIDVIANDRGGKLSLWSLDQVDYANPLGSTELATGSVIEFVDGQVSFTPSGDYVSLAQGESATETFTYAVRLPSGNITWASVEVVIAGVNDAPVAEDVGAIAVSEDGPATGAPASYVASDPDAGSILRFIGWEQPAAGTVSVDYDSAGNPIGDFLYFDPDGAFEYLGEGDEALVSVNAVVADEFGESVDVVVTYRVIGENDAPIASDYSESAWEDEPVKAVSPPHLVFDADLYHPLTFSFKIPIMSRGHIEYDEELQLLEFHTDGQFEYLGAGEVIPVSVPYTVMDETGASDSATIIFNVSGQNDPVVAQDRTIVMNEDAFLRVGPSIFGYDVDRTDSISFLELGDGDYDAGGSAYLDDTGAFVFDPGEDFLGLSEGESVLVSFDYTLRSTDGTQDSGTITLEIVGKGEPAPELASLTTFDALPIMADANMMAI